MNRYPTSGPCYYASQDQTGRTADRRNILSRVNLRIPYNKSGAPCKMGAINQPLQAQVFFDQLCYQIESRAQISFLPAAALC